MENKILKFYFIIVALAAGYGMLISGTRAAIVVPFTGYALFALLSKNTKVIVGGLFLLIVAFTILNFTMIGQGNSYIRRMRTTFHPEKDASFVLRMENQKKMRAYMADKPFGVGLGTAKAAQYSSSEVSKIPTDSWLVMIWVETGIVGLVLYLGIIIFILAKGGHIVMFKVKNKELRGIGCAFLAGILGMFVASYANEVIAQFPNGPIIYMAMAFVFMAERFDQEIQNKIPEDGKAA
ncbi:MAG: O-antigen ligase family protein [Mangrovibacterium sp.]